MLNLCNGTISWTAVSRMIVCHRDYDRRGPLAPSQPRVGSDRQEACPVPTNPASLLKASPSVALDSAARPLAVSPRAARIAAVRIGDSARGNGRADTVLGAGRRPGKIPSRCIVGIGSVITGETRRGGLPDHGRHGQGNEAAGCRGLVSHRIQDPAGPAGGSMAGRADQSPDGPGGGVWP